MRAQPRVVDPTTEMYGPLKQAYEFFNRKLFDDRLPPCLMTVRHHGRAYGYFSFKRFGEIDDTGWHEIAINPRFILQREPREVLSTVVHEMVHCEQFEFGKPSRNAYHNREWGGLMKRIGLYPSDRGMPGGKETGQRMSHYIVEDGPFYLACTELLATGLQLRYGDTRVPPERKEPKSRKFTCNNCGFTAKAKPDEGMLVCAECLRARYPTLAFDLMAVDLPTPAELAWAA